MARVWRADGSAEPVILSGHQGMVESANFSPDGTRIVTASRDGTARVWRTDGSEEPVILSGHQGWVISASFSPDGARIVTASNDGTARVWTCGVKALHDMLWRSSAASLTPKQRRMFLNESP
jgi:WD40 repeat protein